MLVKVIKIVYPGIEGQNFGFSYYYVENTQAIHLTTNICPIRKRLTRNLVVRYKKELLGSSLLPPLTRDIINKTLNEVLLSFNWINDAVEVLSYEI